MNVWLHIGFAKCASTSLQEALRNASGITYPVSGRLHPQAEHLALPLYLQGIDDYRRQWVSEAWVEEQVPALLREIGESTSPVILSSELLASLTQEQLSRLSEMLAPHDTQVIMLYRDRLRYLESTWRHLVYHHDYATDFASFLSLKRHFRFEGVIRSFERHFPIHTFNIDEAGFDRQIMELTGANFSLGQENTGVHLELAHILQQQHQALGSLTFKTIFTPAVKQRMRDAWRHSGPQSIDPFEGPPH